MTQKGTPIVGQACTVTEGPNKGQKGKYTRDDEGNLWCEGDWGGTQCGSGKCKAEATQVSVFEYVDTGGTLVHEVDGMVDLDGLGTFQFNAILDAATGASRSVSAVPIAATSLAALRKGSNVERRAAELLESHLRDQGGCCDKVA